MKTQGQGMVEYALVVVLIGIVVVGVGNLIGWDNLHAAWESVKNLVVV